MADAPIEPFHMDLLLPWDDSRIQRPYRPIGMPPEFVTFIGLIVIAWDAFERSATTLLSALATAANDPEIDKLPGRHFKKRRSAIVKTSRQLFSKDAPSVHKYIAALVADSTHPLEVRTAIVHSHLLLKMTTGEPVNGKLPGTVELACFRTIRREQMQRNFRIEHLKDCYFAIGNLAGRIDALTENSPVLDVASPDRPFLQAFLQNYYSKPPISPIFPPQPSPSHR